MQTLYTETADSKYRPSVLLGRMVGECWLLLDLGSLD
jgi:hypothetical protein